MMQALVDWVEKRTGAKQLLHEALYENIPSGARWRYITGSMLVFAFVTQAITGIFLWMAYSPSSQTAYESVFYIQHEMTGGWLLRGIHHFMAQAMVVVMALHLLQVIIDGAYKAPREVNYWLGLVLMQLVMGLGLTGYLLPWDQKGYWATNVATNLMTLVPFVGKEIQMVAVGGSDYGNHTLTRFFAMHAGVLPALLIGFLALHIAAFRKHGITAKITPGRADQYFWPHQVLMDAVGCLVLLGIVFLCAIHFDVSGFVAGTLPEAHRGAELGAPADPSLQYSAARPEWYYLFLFQLLKYFHGTQEVIGALVLPGVAMTILGLMPFIGRSSLGHKFNVAFILLLLAGAGVLTVIALQEDAANPDFQIAKVEAEENAKRTVELINRRQTNADGTVSDRLLIQRQGAVYLLRNDPLTNGPKLFAQHCSSCHSYVDRSKAASEGDGHGHGKQLPLLQSAKASADGKSIEKDAAGNAVYEGEVAGAPNLFGFGSRAWIRGLLDPKRISALEYGKPADPKDGNPDSWDREVIADYFGSTKHRGGQMAEWVQEHAELLKDSDKPDDDVDAIVAALSAQAELRSQKESDAKDKELIQKGLTLIEQNCMDCHRLGANGELGTAPDLTQYASYSWTLAFLTDPTHERFYREENDRMPSFAKDLSQPVKHTVSIRELSLIVNWLRGEYYQPADATPILPTSEEEARHTAVMARLPVGGPAPKVIGAPAKP